MSKGADPIKIHEIERMVREGASDHRKTRAACASEIDELRRALIEPQLTAVEISDAAKPSAVRELWIVTRPIEDGYVVLFDPESHKYGLALTDNEGPPRTVPISWGELLSTFMAARLRFTTKGQMRDPIQEQLYLYLMANCDSCLANFDTFETDSPADPMESWSLRAARAARAAGWSVAAEGKICCPRCSEGQGT